MVRAECMASIGAVSNPDQANTKLGKAGRNRWLGKRPSVRGVAMNPVDHPHGGGEGRTSGGRHPRSEEHTSELQSLMRISYAVFCLKTKNNNATQHNIQLKQRTQATLTRQKTNRHKKIT